MSGPQGCGIGEGEGEAAVRRLGWAVAMAGRRRADSRSGPAGDCQPSPGIDVFSRAKAVCCRGKAPALVAGVGGYS